MVTRRLLGPRFIALTIIGRRPILVTLIVALGCVLHPSPAGSEQSISDRMGVRHWTGQAVSPVYEGFDQNQDGTYNLWFGYLNKNYEEALDIPIGPDNTFEPGGDRNQPTHFAPRRHKDVFRVVVPGDFGNRKLVWKLTVRGATESIEGTLNPVWQIDRRRTTRGGRDDAVDSNTPPVVTVRPMEQTIPSGVAATLDVSATDDGLPRNRRPLPITSVPAQLYAVPPVPPARGAAPTSQASVGAGRGGPQTGPGLSAEWFKYRGPGTVTFSSTLAMLAQGRGTTSATFTEPGDYLLQVVVDDGSGESAGNFGYHCCWTSVEVKVHVTGAAATRQR
jgi:hypothetical protein